MKTTVKLFSLLLFCSISLSAFCQKDALLSTLPQTKEEFVASEKNVLATINWLANTPADQDADKRKEQFAMLTAWIINSPTVTIEVNSNVLTFTKKNSDLLIYFMAGWTKYVLENNYSKDLVKSNLAGIRMAMNIYQKGIAMKKDKEMEKLIEKESSGTLESWVTEQLAKK